MKNWVVIVGAALLLAACARGSGRDLGYAPVVPTVIATPVALFFAGIDSDRDLATSQAELTAALEAGFVAADDDRDGSITIIATTRLLEQWLGTRDSLLSSPSFDGNGDNAVSRAEFDAAFTREFTALDDDNDGRLTRAELITVTIGGYRPDRASDTPPGVQRPN